MKQLFTAAGYPFSHKYAIVAGILALPVGLYFGVSAAVNSTGEGYNFFFIMTSLGSFATTYGAYYLLMARANTINITRAVLAGLITGSLSHYVIWLLLLVYQFGCYEIFGLCQDSLNARPENIIDMFLLPASFSLVSLGFLGLQTIAMSVALGLGFWMYSRKRFSEKHRRHRGDGQPGSSEDRAGE